MSALSRLDAPPAPPLPPADGPLTMSVALCTYNGAAFLPEQLRSILGQTVLPDELVACDDGSDDQTVQQLRRFAGEAPFPVHVRVNPQRLGPAQNFGQAIAGCSGQAIVLCDQDDVWHPQRLELTRDAFLGVSGPGLVFGNAEVCDAAAQPLGYTLWDSVLFPRGLRRRVATQGFEVLLRQNVATGATMAFLARFRSLVLPIDPGWMHDGWIALLVAAVAPVVAIERPLIRYRQHAQQSVGALRRSLYQQYRNARAMDREVFQQQMAMYDAARTRLEGAIDVPAAHLQRLEEKVQHLKLRSRIRRREISRLGPSVQELLSGRYQHFSLGWKSFAQDLLL